MVLVGTRDAIHKRIGSQTFRHTIRYTAEGNGEGVKTVQELNGTPNSRITLDVYTRR